MKVVCGLGNPGRDYDVTRHNVGWWLVDRLSADWGLGPFRRESRALAAGGRVGEQAVRLLKPTTYMNRSGAAVAPLRSASDFEVSRDLLIVVDDVSLDVGRIRFRANGSAGGHNGLKSVEHALGTREYPRLKIGVGGAPSGVDLADWVLSPFSDADEDEILAMMPDMVEGVEVWMLDGIQAAMNQCNR